MILHSDQIMIFSYGQEIKKGKKISDAISDSASKLYLLVEKLLVLAFSQKYTSNSSMSHH